MKSKTKRKTPKHMQKTFSCAIKFKRQYCWQTPSIFIIISDLHNNKRKPFKGHFVDIFQTRLMGSKVWLPMVIHFSLRLQSFHLLDEIHWIAKLNSSYCSWTYESECEMINGQVEFCTSYHRLQFRNANLNTRKTWIELKALLGWDSKNPGQPLSKNMPS